MITSACWCLSGGGSDFLNLSMTGVSSDFDFTGADPVDARSSRPDGSAALRAAPSSTGKLIASASRKLRTPTERQSSPDPFKFGSSSGRRASPMSAQQRTSHKPEPRNSQMYALHG